MPFYWYIYSDNLFMGFETIFQSIHLAVTFEYVYNDGDLSLWLRKRGLYN